MIDISQWRASIGFWYGHQILCTTGIQTSSSTTLWVESLWSGGLGDEAGGNLTFSFFFFLVLLLILSGDIELNPGPKTGIYKYYLESCMNISLFTSTELTSTNALRLLVKNGFIVEDKWTKLTSLLGVSLKERKRLETMASSNQDYHFALEQSLQWWITNSIDPSWEKLVSSVESCGDMNVQVANMMKRQVDTKDEGIGSIYPSIIQIIFV